MVDQNLPRRVTVETKFGRDAIVVRPILPARRLLVVAEPCRIPKGRVLPARVGRKPVTLERDVVLEPGEILFPHRDEETRVLRHDRYAGGLFDAIRGRAQVLLGYGARSADLGEQAEIHALISVVRDIWTIVARYGNLTADERRVLARRIRGAELRLERVRNPEKREARDKLAASATVRDALGRRNPGATMARLGAAGRRLGMRLEEIRAITPVVGYYEVALWNEYHRIYRLLTDVYRTLDSLVGPRGILRGDSKKVERSRQGIVLRLESYVADFSSIFVEPFVFLRDRLTAELGGAARLLRERGTPMAAIELLDRSLRSLRFRFVQRTLEELRLELSCAVASSRARERRSDLIVRVNLVGIATASLDDRDFRAKPKEAILAVLREARRALGKNAWREAKERLTRASLLFSRPVSVG